MPAPRIAIIGHGKMGRAVESLATERGFTIAGIIDRPHGSAQAFDPAELSGAEVAIEFTEPSAAPANIQAAAVAGCPIVVGTTGWYDRLPEMSEAVLRGGGAMLWAPNFSIGVLLMMAIVEEAATRMASVGGFDAQIVETHHAEKRDAPSGTAKAIADVAARALGRDVPIASVRTGFIPGTHDVIFDAPFEQLLLRHSARDRRVFADGALRAAEWLVGRRGVFQLRDMIRQGTT